MQAFEEMQAMEEGRPTVEQRRRRSASRQRSRRRTEANRPPKVTPPIVQGREAPKVWWTAAVENVASAAPNSDISPGHGRCDGFRLQAQEGSRHSSTKTAASSEPSHPSLRRGFGIRPRDRRGRVSVTPDG